MDLYKPITSQLLLGMGFTLSGTGCGFRRATPREDFGLAGIGTGFLQLVPVLQEDGPWFAELWSMVDGDEPDTSSVSFPRQFHTAGDVLQLLQVCGIPVDYPELVLSTPQ